MIKEIIFVTNSHILVQFDNKFVPLKSPKNPKMIADEKEAVES